MSDDAKVPLPNLEDGAPATDATKAESKAAQSGERRLKFGMDQGYAWLAAETAPKALPMFQ